MQFARDNSQKVINKKRNLHRFRHQIFPSNQAEDGDFVVFIEDAERPQNLIQG